MRLMRHFSGGRGRRAFLKTAGAIGLAGLAGCTGGGNGNGDDENTVRFVLNPAEEQTDIVEEWSAFRCS